MILVLVNFLVDFMNLAYIKVDGSKTSFDMYLFIYLRQEVLQVWNYTRVSKWWHHFHFALTIPLIKKRTKKIILVVSQACWSGPESQLSFKDEITTVMRGIGSRFQFIVNQLNILVPKVGTAGQWVKEIGWEKWFVRGRMEKMVWERESGLK